MTTTAVTVSIIWHPGDERSKDSDATLSLPSQLFRTLHSDPQLVSSERCGIPVTMHTGRVGPDGQVGLPPTPRFEPLVHTVLVVLLGDALLSDRSWRSWLTNLLKTVGEDPGVTVVPIALSKAAVGQSHLLGERNIERVYDARSTVERDRHVRITVLRRVVRFLNGDAPFKIFVSHAKADGAGVARALGDYLDTMRGEAWVDVERIEAGQNFRSVLKEALATSSAFVAVVSDEYAMREWCRWEVQMAREKLLSIVVLDMVSDGQRRSLGSLGASPVIRYNAQWRVKVDGPVPPEALTACARVYEAILQVKLLDLYFAHRMRAVTARFPIADDAYRFLGSPPDLLTMITRSNELAGRTVVYPDPPLPDFEVELLSKTTTARLATPLSLVPTLAMSADSTHHHRLRIAVSISDPPREELTELALSTEHVQALVVHVSPLLLSAGHTLAYGGDPVREFTQTLADVERGYRFARNEEKPMLVNYVAPYLQNTESAAALSDVMDVVEVTRRPEGDESPTQRIIRDLTAMRQQMLIETDARIVAAGALFSQDPGTRRAPGVLEEAWLSARAGQPLIVIGGFGGAGRLLVDALRNRLNAEEVARLRTHFADRAVLAGSTLEADFSDMLAVFGPDTELHDELNAAERDILQTSTDIDAVAAMVLTAIERISRHQR